jgi:hypothetical protein
MGPPKALITERQFEVISLHTNYPNMRDSKGTVPFSRD